MDPGARERFMRNHHHLYSYHNATVGGHRHTNNRSPVYHDEIHQESSDEESDTPMDLSVKRPVMSSHHHHGRRSSSDGSGSDERPLDPRDLRVPNSQSMLLNELNNPYSLFNYYYLMNQSNPLTSRANVAASMAEAYSMLSERMGLVPNGHPLTNPNDHHHHHHQHHPSSRSPVIITDSYKDHHHQLLSHSRVIQSKFESTSVSPSSSLTDIECNLKAELRSADTTNLIDHDSIGQLGVGGERKRISRPLTGRHVRHGTGASPSTLLILRKLLKERQRLRDLGLPLPTAKKTRKATKRK